MLNSLTGISGRKVLLLTGGSGLLGSGMMPWLQNHCSDRTIVVFTRRTNAVKEATGIIPICADIARDDLGLEPAISRELQNSVTEIVHCAADVRFNLTLEESTMVNTCGTKRLLDFAEQCPGLQKFAHVSTLYVAGRRPGLVTEQELHHGYGYFNVYEQSKHEAEQLVFARMRRLPLVVYRPSAVIGSAATGKISQKNFFHTLIALAPLAARLPCLPIDATAPIDLIADDWCCRAMALLFDECFEAGAVHHLCAGKDFSLNAGDLIDLVFRIVEEQTGIRIARPPLGNWNQIQQHRAAGPSGNERTLLDLISQFMPHMAVNQPFDRGRTATLLENKNLFIPAPAQFVERVIRQTCGKP